MQGGEDGADGEPDQAPDGGGGVPGDDRDIDQAGDQISEAEIHLLDAGHFALDEKIDKIAGLILDFMARRSK